MKGLLLRLALAGICALSPGCAGMKSAYESYNRSVSRDIAIGATSEDGAYASYTVHLGPQGSRTKTLGDK